LGILSMAILSSVVATLVGIVHFQNSALHSKFLRNGLISFPV
jgi:hypothetical protein